MFVSVLPNIDSGSGITKSTTMCMKEREDEQGGLPKLNTCDILRRIQSEFDEKRGCPQELWVALRSILIVCVSSVPVGLLHDVEEFCLAVFESFKPDATSAERDKQIGQVNLLAAPLNLQTGQVLEKLTGKDNAFLVRWSIVTGASMIAMRQTNPDVGLVLSPFATFEMELQQTDQPELVLSIWLYSLYTTIFALAYGTIPAGLLGIASFGIGLVTSERKTITP